MGIACLLGSVGAAGFAVRTMREQGSVIALFFAAPWVVVVGLLIRRAMAQRASDVLLDARGIRIDGGRLHGRRFDWKRIDPEGFVVKRERRNFIRVGSQTTWGYRLVAHHDGGKLVVLAASLDDDERASLEDLAGLLRAGLARFHARAEPERVEARPDEMVIVCPACEAPVTPDDAAEVACRFCGGTVAMRDDVRRRVRDEKTVDEGRAVEATLTERLLRMPGPRAANRLVALVAVALALIGCLALARDVGAVVVAAGGCVALLGATRLVTADRHALRTLTLGFAARRSRAADTAACRHCGGPLPTTARVLVTCAYCEAVNFVGLDLDAQVRRTRRDVDDLRHVFRERLDDRSRARVLIALGVVLGLMGVGLRVANGDARAWDLRHRPSSARPR
jgi:hypothetical protein